MNLEKFLSELISDRPEIDRAVNKAEVIYFACSGVIFFGGLAFFAKLLTNIFTTDV